MFFARTINLQNSLVSDFPELVKGIHFNHTKAIFGEDMNLLRGITLQSRLGWCFGLLVAIGRYHAVDAQSMFINAGSDIPYTDGNGNTWVPDSPYVNSGLSFTTGIDIEGTDLGPLYQSERVCRGKSCYSSFHYVLTFLFPYCCSMILSNLLK
jgi:hypothetical protein